MRKLFIAVAMTGVVLAGQAVAEEAAPVVAATPAHYTTSDTPLGVLLDNAASRAIIEQHLPNVVADPRLEMARGMTLKALQPFSAELTDEKLAEIDAELANAH